MKKSYLTVMTVCMLFACSKKNNIDSVNNAAPIYPISSFYTADETMDSQPISIDSANKMIKSYLISINYTQTDTNLRSLTFNADSLRNYLNDTSNGKIVYVKFMLAHRLDYINAGGYGVKAGFSNRALTMVLVGYDHNNNYVYNHQQMAYDHMMPCPTQCPSGGTASADLLQ